MKKDWIVWIGLVGALWPAEGRSYPVIAEQHVDVIGFTYSAEDGLGTRSRTDSTVYNPGEVLIFDGPTGTTSASRPSGSQWDFLGVAAGEPIYFWPQTLIAGRIFAGFEAESVPAGTFAAVSTGDTRAPSVEPWLKVELVDVRFFDLEGNAEDADFSLWQVPGQGAPPKVWMSTADGGITASDVFYVTEGGHAHANWGFGQAGYYQIDFRLSGVLAGSLETVATPVTTWHFGVEHQPMAIPEVSTIALLALALGVGWVARRKFHSSEQTKTNQN